MESDAVKTNLKGDHPNQVWLNMGINTMVLNTTFNNISAISVIGGEYRRPSTRTKPPTCSKSLTNFITSSTPRHEWDSNS